jgi:hypothetical protein
MGGVHCLGPPSLPTLLIHIARPSLQVEKVLTATSIGMPEVMRDINEAGTWLGAWEGVRVTCFRTATGMIVYRKHRNRR